MREIKFRVWDKKYKEICKVLDLDFDLGWVGVLTPDGTKIRENLENVELMQYTGLKDKNGKEIYEGDIVELKIHTYNKDGKVENIQANWIIEWHKDGCWVLNSKKAYEPVSICSLIYGLEAVAKVLGNIYENPELLEVKDDS